MANPFSNIMFTPGEVEMEIEWAYEDLADWTEECGSKSVGFYLSDFTQPPTGLLELSQVTTTTYKLKLRKMVDTFYEGSYEFIYALWFTNYQSDYKVSTPFKLTLERSLPAEPSLPVELTRKL